MGAVMGVKDFNNRNDRYTPELGSAALVSCDIRINPTMYDTGSNSKGSIMAYRAARVDNHDSDTDQNNLHSIVGCARSDASKPMATLGTDWYTGCSLAAVDHYENSYTLSTLPPC